MTRQEEIRRCEWLLKNRCAPEHINALKDNEVIVFGSKPDGHHVGGAAKLAVEKFGATEGKGEGLSGQSYAIPVHKHHVYKMDEAVDRFVDFADSNKDKTFYVLPVGCGKANMDIHEVARMFESAIEVDNVYLPAIFIKALLDYVKLGVIKKSGNLKRLISDSLRIMEDNSSIFSLFKKNSRNIKCIPKGRIAISHYNAYVLDDNGSMIEVFPQKYPLKNLSPLKNIAATREHFIGLDYSGRLIFNRKDYERPRDLHPLAFGISNIDTIARIRDVVSLNACEGRITCLLSDNHVVCINTELGGYPETPHFYQYVNNWHDIIQVASGYDNIIGVDNQGKVLYHTEWNNKDDNMYATIRSAIQVDAYSHYYGNDFSAVLTENGTVTSAEFLYVSKWRNIVQIAVGWDIILGLKRNGKVEIECTKEHKEIADIVSKWDHIVYIETILSYVVAIREDGTILCLDI